MVDKKTTVSIKMKAEGAEKAHKDIKKAFGAIDTKGTTKGLKQLDHWIGQVGRQLRGLEAGFKTLNRNIRMDAGVASTKEFTKEIERLERQIESLTKAKEKDAAADDKRQRRRSFGMGVMQGAGVGEYFPEKELRANVAGRMVGRAGRGAAGMVGAVGQSFTGGMFSGVGGVSAGIAALPGGGLVSGQIQAGAAAAQQNLAMQRSRMGFRQFQAGDIMDRANAAGSRSLAAALASGSVETMGKYNARAMDAEYTARESAMAVPDRDFGRSLAIARIKKGTKGGNYADATATFEGNSETMQKHMIASAVKEFRDKDMKKRQENADKLGPEAYRKTLAEGKRARDSAYASGKQGVLNSASLGLRGAGAKYLGVSENQALQFASGMLQAGGGGAGQLVNKDGSAAGMTKTAMAASTGYGISGDISGAFLRGQKGGGAGKGAEKDFVNAMRSAVSLGLKGSDLTNYMRQTAQGIQAFERTGLPINDASIAGMGRQLQGRGMGGTRSETVSRGLMGVAQNVGMQGPQSAIEMLMMQDMFGFTGEGGVDEMAATMKKMRKGKVDKGGLKKFIESIKGGATGGAAELQVMQAFGSMGIPVGDVEGLLNDDPMAMRKVQKQLENSAKVSSGAIRRKGTAPGQMQRQAGLENMTADAGGKVLTPIQNLEEASKEMLKNFTSFSNVADTVSKQILKTTEDIGPLIADIATSLEYIVSMGKK